MTLLHITPSYKPAFCYGGPTLSVSHLCETLARQRHTVDVLTTTANGRTELAVPTAASQLTEGVKVRYYRRSTGDHSHLSPALLWQVWQSCRHYDAVHIHSWWNTVAVFSVLICRIRGVRPMVSPRGMLSPYTMRSRAKRIFHRLTGRVLLKGVVLHATSEQEEREIAGLVPGTETCCLPNLVPLPPISANQTEAVAPDGQYHILFLGRLDPKKGLEILFHALSMLSFPCRLTVAGAGTPEYEAVLRRLAEALGISNRVEWTGWVEGPVKYRLLACADVFVLPSHNENFANAALEALAMGTPVVLSDTVGIAAYVQHTGFGRICPAEAGAVADALAILAAKGCGFERSIMAEQTRRDFDPDRLAENYVDVYQKMAGLRS